jgi:hypothetical protein
MAAIEIVTVPVPNVIILLSVLCWVASLLMT